MKLRKNMCKIAFVLLLTCVFLVGCSKKNDDVITLTFQSHRTDIANSAIKDLMDRYMAENPNIKIEIETANTSDLNLINATKMAANELPDVGVILRSIPVNELHEYYIPLEDLGVNADNYYFYNNLVSDGHCYGLNCAANPVGIIYSKKAFEKAGITEVPKTMEEFFDVCDRLKAAGITPFITGYKDKWPLQIYSEEMLWSMQQTGDVEYKNKLQYSDTLFDDTEGGLYDAFKLVRAMNERGYFENDITSATLDASTQAIARGDAAMWYAGPWFAANVVGQGANVEDIGMFNYPGAKGVLLADDQVYGIPVTSKHPEEAKALLKWMLLEGNYSAATGGMSGLKSDEITDPWISELLEGNDVLEAGGYDPGFLNIYNQGEFDLVGSLQEYIISDRPEAIVERLNTKWAETRAKLGL